VLARRGMPLTRLERVRHNSPAYRSYLATRTTGERLTLHVLDRDLIGSGALHALYRVIRIRSEVAPPPALSLERVAERRSLLALAAVAADVPVPRLVAGVPCGRDTIVLAYQAVSGTVLRVPTEGQLDELWSSVSRLHQRLITHRGLAVGAILVDPHGHVLLPIPTDGAVFATQLRISLERAQLLATCAQLVGAERAVRSARTVLSQEQLAAALAVLQPVALPRQTRLAIKADPGMLEALREEIQGQANQDIPELTRVERVRPRTIISVAAVIVAGYLIAGQFGSVNLNSVFATARWQWIPLVLLASGATYPSAALSLIGYVRERLPFPRTVLVQVAAEFAGFVTPPAVGGIAINIQFLRKAKLTTTAAATSVGTSQVVNAASHAVLLAAFAAATGTSSRSDLPIPGWMFAVLGTAVTLLLLALAIPSARRALAAKVLPPVREALPRLLNLLTDPVKLAEALLGSLFLNLSNIAALWFAVLAFHGTVGFRCSRGGLLGRRRDRLARPDPRRTGRHRDRLLNGPCRDGHAQRSGGQRGAALSTRHLLASRPDWLGRDALARAPRHSLIRSHLINTVHSWSDLGAPRHDSIRTCGCWKVLHQLCDLRIFVEQAAESVLTDDRGVRVSGAARKGRSDAA